MVGNTCCGQGYRTKIHKNKCVALASGVKARAGDETNRRSSADAGAQPAGIYQTLLPKTVIIGPRARPGIYSYGGGWNKLSAQRFPPSAIFLGCLRQHQGKITRCCSTGSVWALRDVEVRSNDPPTVVSPALGSWKLNPAAKYRQAVAGVEEITAFMCTLLDSVR